MLTPEHHDALSAVRNEMALVRFMTHGLDNGLTMGAAEVEGLFAMLDRWHGALSLALNSDPEEVSTHD